MVANTPGVGPVRYYFLDDQNSAHSHPIPVHRNSQLPKRTRIISFLLRPCWRASHAGAKNIAIVIAIARMYFKIKIISICIFYWGGAVLCPAVFVIVFHILNCYPILLLCVTIGCTLPFCRCVTWNRFLFVRRLSQPPGRRLLYLRFRHCDAKL